MRGVVGFMLFVVLAQAHIYAQDTAAHYPVGEPRRLVANRDTVRALTHLFQRNRKSMRIKLAIVGAVIDALVIRMWTHSYEPPNKNLPPAVAAMTVVGSGSSIPTSSYVAVGVATAVAVEIVVQKSYGKNKLRALLDDYETGKPIPKKIRSRIRLRDFDQIDSVKNRGQSCLSLHK